MRFLVVFFAFFVVVGCGAENGVDTEDVSQDEAILDAVLGGGERVVAAAGRPDLGGPLLPEPGTGNDSDGDGIKDNRDNCPNHVNPGQDDTDNDGCGNVCDGDFDQDWIAGWLDFGALSAAVGNISPVHNLTEPVDDIVTLPGDIQVFTKLFGKSVCGR